MSSGYPQVEIGIFGGSGLYALLDSYDEVVVETPYGPPSDAIMVGEIESRSVAFLPRHGRGHTIAPHKINYRANIWAMRRWGSAELSLHLPSDRCKHPSTRAVWWSVTNL